MRIDADKPIPKYLQLKDILRHYFKNEHYELGQQIPTENDLMQQFQVSRNTVRQALGELENEGFIYKKRGSGSFFSGKTQEDVNQTYLIGVLTPIIASYIYPQIIEGIDDVAHKRRYNIVLGNSKGLPEKELLCLEHLLDKKIDGLLLEPAGGIQKIEDSKTFRMLKTLTIPVVFMDWVINQPDVSYISLDDVEGGMRATSYLIDAGHKRIACVYPNDHIPGLQRYQGYRKALEANRIKYESTLDKAGTILRWNDADYAPALTKELLDLGEARPTAIFFFNDAAALRSYATIREAGLKIPEDISLIGFDDSEMASLADVPLTSVVHPKYQIGKLAAETLFDHIESKENRVHRQIIINPTIAMRNSVASPSAHLKVF
ncbi:MAG: GntR family transcriptional regulator [Sedimentisphaerales bacterium]|nr:GntR family transcriptional regulator [Sedimentisphaerales bacterium]